MAGKLKTDSKVGTMERGEVRRIEYLIFAGRVFEARAKGNDDGMWLLLH